MSVAIVTGGLGGIGRSICRRLRQSGYTVVAADLAHSGPAADNAAGFACHLDLSHPDSVAEVCALAELAGPITALVNCAGIIAKCEAQEPPDAQVGNMFDVNLFGAARMTAAAAKLMRGGAIVNVSSVSSRLPEIQNAVFYGASKSALETYTRSAARSLASRGIRVNAVAPGFIDVDMSDAMRIIAEGETSPLRRVALARMGTADEVAECVEFLLSDRASYVVGATLVVDGGLVLS